MTSPPQLARANVDLAVAALLVLTLAAVAAGRLAEAYAPVEVVAAPAHPPVRQITAEVPRNGRSLEALCNDYDLDEAACQLNRQCPGLLGPQSATLILQGRPDEACPPAQSR